MCFINFNYLKELKAPNILKILDIVLSECLYRFRLEFSYRLFFDIVDHVALARFDVDQFGLFVDEWMIDLKFRVCWEIIFS